MNVFLVFPNFVFTYAMVVTSNKIRLMKLKLSEWQTEKYAQGNIFPMVQHLRKKINKRAKTKKIIWTTLLLCIWDSVNLCENASKIINLRCFYGHIWERKKKKINQIFFLDFPIHSRARCNVNECKFMEFVCLKNVGTKTKGEFGEKKVAKSIWNLVIVIKLPSNTCEKYEICERSWGFVVILHLMFVLRNL